MSYINYENGYSLFRSVGNAIKGQEGLLSDTVGWTGKNMLPNSGASISGDLSFTVNSDGSVTINGTADSSADATFQIYRGLYLPSGTSFIVSADYYSADVCLEIWEYGWGNRQTLTTGALTVNYSDASHDSDRIIRIFVKKGTTVNNVTIKPMIRDARISDSTYEPHHDSVDACKYNRSEANVLGAKNLLNNTATTDTIENVTFTVNADKTVTANTGTGGATGQANFYIANIANQNLYLPAGKYIVSGVDQSNDYRVYLRNNDYSIQYDSSSDGAEKEITVPSGQYFNYMCVILSGKTVTNKVFKPMIRLAADTDNTYAPYAMTNRELTEKATLKSDACTDIITGATVSDAQGGNHVYKIGGTVQLVLALEGVTVAAWTDIASIPSGFKPVAAITALQTTRTLGKTLIIQANGRIQSTEALNNVNINIYGVWLTNE